MEQPRIVELSAAEREAFTRVRHAHVYGCPLADLQHAAQGDALAAAVGELTIALMGVDDTTRQAINRAIYLIEWAHVDTKARRVNG